MSTSSTDKGYLVTGAASGMGLATAQTLLDQGARVALCDMNNTALENLVKSLDDKKNSRVLAQAVDITNRASIKTFFDKAKSHFGKLDGIANFAGTGGHQLGVQSIWETNEEEYNFIMTVNVKGLYNILTEALAPGFLEEGASVVHVASMFAQQGYKDGAVFAASKHAALGMVRSAAKETGPRVRVNCLLPGAVDTPMFRQVRSNAKQAPVVGTPIPRPGSPQEIADVTAFLLGNASSFVTGAAWNVDGGANA